MVKLYKEGEAFGELALMYQVPRQATIKAVSDNTKCFALDRLTFRKTLLTSWQKKRQLYEEFLSKNHLLKCLDNYQKSIVADNLREYHYLAGQHIITAGDANDKRFLFLIDGQATAEKFISTDDEKKTVVMKYSPGDYFGELALISDQPRQADVIAQTDCTCAGLDKDAFERLLGPCQQVLQANQSKYLENEQKAQQDESTASTE